MERKKFVISRSHYWLFMSILGLCSGTEGEVDLDLLKNELQVIHNLTVKLERDLDSYQVQHKHTSNNSDQFINELHTYTTTANPPTEEPPTEEPPTFGDKNHVQRNSTLDNNKSKHWPTFQELLLLSNRKYDWKNDRWIKIKSEDSSATKHPESMRSHFIFRRIRNDHYSSKHYKYIISAIPAHPRH